MTQPLAELYGDCMVVLKVSWCGIISHGEVPGRRLGPRRHPEGDEAGCAEAEGDHWLRCHGSDEVQP